jgi:hypothetical protein
MRVGGHLSAPATWRLAASLALAAALGFVSPSPVLADEEAARAVLAEHGLVRLGRRTWAVPEERKLREQYERLPRLRESIVTAERELDAAIDANRERWNAAQPLVAAAKQSLAKLSPSDPQRAVVEQQIASLERGSTRPALLGAQPGIRQQVIALSATRNELLAAIASIRAAAATLETKYAELASRTEVSEALRQLGDDQRLGPARNYAADQPRLAEFERLAATAWVPIYSLAGQTRVAALVGERTPVTFSYTSASDQPLVLTHSAAEAAGVMPDAVAPRETIEAAPGRKVSAQKVTIPQLRLGKLLLEDASGYVLAPEHEDVGNRLGGLTLSGHAVRLVPERLRMWIDAEP